MNNAINEIKVTLEGTMSRITETEDRISEVEDKMVEINEAGRKKEKLSGKKQNSHLNPTVDDSHYKVKSSLNNRG